MLNQTKPKTQFILVLNLKKLNTLNLHTINILEFISANFDDYKPKLVLTEKLEYYFWLKTIFPFEVQN